MIRLTLSYMRDSMLAYRDILLNAVGIARRSKLNFGAGFFAEDNADTQSTDVQVVGHTLTVNPATGNETIAVGELGRFDVAAPAVATLAAGAVNGDRVSVMIANTSAADVTIAMANVATYYGGTLTLSTTGVRQFNFIWVVPPIEGVSRWYIESTVTL